MQRTAWLKDTETSISASCSKTVQAGEAKFVCFGHQGRLIYDVPTAFGRAAELLDKPPIRVVVNAEKTIIISVLPNEFRSETYRRNTKRSKGRSSSALRMTRNYERRGTNH